MSDTQYVALVASLPALGGVLEARHAPINEVRLAQRLRQLEPAHYAEVLSVADLFSWARLPLLGDDAALIRRARKVIPTLSSPALAELARDRMELRTVLAALRHRHNGSDTPPEGRDWGYGRYLRKISANWREPDFGVERAFPFIPAARDALDKGDARRLERLILETVWRQVNRVSGGHYFDYEAVVFYVVRWNVLYRWTRYDAQSAAARFHELADAALETVQGPLGAVHVEKAAA